jgi:hypothetical protein
MLGGMKTSGRRLILALALAATVGCGKEESSPPPAAAPPVASTPAPEPVKPPPPPPAETPKAPADLPKAEDVLPPGEVSKGSLVVLGDGYRFQVKPNFKIVDHPRGKPAYQAKVAGIISDAEVTLFVVREPFTGDLEALVKRETDQVVAKGGKLQDSMEALTKVSGKFQSGHRFFARVDGRLDMLVFTVHDGSAWIFHAETPDQNNPWPNVGSDMMIRGSTFHVAPPK